MDEAPKCEELRGEESHKSHSSVAVSDSSQTGNTFHFWNGDEYSGDYMVIKEKQKIIMSGKGVYKTSDGESYEGFWEDDCLRGTCRITFADESEFHGNLDKMVIQGPGRYTFKEDVEIEGDFVDNAIQGKVYLTDPTRHLWTGNVNSDDVYLYLYPMHSFWNSVLSLTLKDQLFYGEAEEEGVFHKDNIK